MIDKHNYQEMVEEYNILTSLLDMHPDNIPRFSDIGYKHYTMPEGLSIFDYERYIDDELYPDYGIKRYAFREHKCEGYSVLDWKEIDNLFIRFESILNLEDIPQSEWTESEHRLLKYIISDIDFYSSERQFREIFEQCRESVQPRNMPKQYKCPYPYFHNIGYKYYNMPRGLTMQDYCSIINRGDKDSYLYKETDDWTEEDLKDFLNERARSQIFTLLESEKECTEELTKLLEYAISDLDFYSSELQFQEIKNLFSRCK